MATPAFERKRQSRAKFASEGFTEVSFRLPKESVDRLDRLAEKVGITRGEALRRLFAKVLDQP